MLGDGGGGEAWLRYKLKLMGRACVPEGKSRKAASSGKNLNYG